MSYETLLYDLSEGVATITLNRPERMNALSTGLLDDLKAAIDAAVAGGARALLLTGAGVAFCSGADLHGGLPDDLGALLEAHYHPVAAALADLDIPVVTAINGPAVGAGLSIALAGDIVLAAESAYLLLAFANIGLVPDAGATWLVARSIGRAKALEMALLGEKVSAREALALGLVTRVVPEATLMNDARAIALKLATGPSVALGLIRKQVTAALDTSRAAMLGIEAANQRRAGHTGDFREAVAAFGEKRKPQFRGA